MESPESGLSLEIPSSDSFFVKPIYIISIKFSILNF